MPVRLHRKHRQAVPLILGLQLLPLQPFELLLLEPQLLLLLLQALLDQSLLLLELFLLQKHFRVLLFR
ncbi:MAG: hypothetical protein MUF20_03490 [Methylotetracoccus sp.]|jgi:hypothetical protein|nr:hypothetical protein [Methylotetracoccus sp.]